MKELKEMSFGVSQIWSQLSNLLFLKSYLIHLASVSSPVKQVC